MAETLEPDVVDLLVAQHEQIRSLLTRVAAAEGERKRDAFDNLVRLMVTHENAEEQVVHPAARAGAGDAAVDARLLEENDVKVLLADLYKMGTGDRLFDVQFRALERAFVSHAAEEERTEFPALRRTTDPQRLRRMGRVVRAAEAITPKRPHSLAGTHPWVNLLAGPPIALFERLRATLVQWRRAYQAHRR
jgi:hemerythrin superfamily protein